MPHWTLHDLRRTARSLLARAGVADNIAERVLGHAIAGVEGVYNRFDYAAEKADALDRLARLIDRIVNRDIMSKEVLYCFEDDDVDDVVQNMADIKVRRLPVLNHEKRLVGILRVL